MRNLHITLVFILSLTLATQNLFAQEQTDRLESINPFLLKLFSLSHNYRDNYPENSSSTKIAYYDFKMIFEDPLTGETATAEKVLTDPSLYNFVIYKASYSQSNEPKSLEEVLRIKDLTNQESLITDHTSFINHTEPSFQRERPLDQDFFLATGTHLQSGAVIQKVYIEEITTTEGHRKTYIGTIEATYGVLKRKLFGPVLYSRSLIEINPAPGSRHSIKWTSDQTQVYSNLIGNIKTRLLNSSVEERSTIRTVSDISLHSILNLEANNSNSVLENQRNKCSFYLKQKPFLVIE